MGTFRVIIAGTRTFNDYELLKTYCDKKLSRMRIDHEIVIVSGHAKGADMLGERYAQDRGYATQLYPAYWDEYGKSAGIRRNVKMAENADALIAFWDGKSSGTKHMIAEARKRGLMVAVKLYGKDNL